MSILKTILLFVLVVLTAVGIYMPPQSTTLGGIGGREGVPVTASSSTYTITTTSVMLVATSTSKNRAAVRVGNLNCTAAGVLTVFDGKGVAATSLKGTSVLASSTQDFGPGQASASYNALTAIESVGTCTVPVTEWTYNF